MKLFILIIVLGMATIGTFLGYRVLGLLKITKQLRTDRNELIEQRGKQSDQLRLKGIEIDELKADKQRYKSALNFFSKELDKYSNVEIKVALTDNEKQMILNALDSSQYKAKVEDPKTNYFIREINRNLKEKIKESIKK